MHLSRVLRTLAAMAARMAPMLMVTVFAHGQSVSYVPYDSTDVAWVGTVELFTASDALHGVELWRSDGTATGTYLVTDIWPGMPGSYPRSLVAAYGRVFLNANDGTHGAELWTSDGTAGGTYMVSDIAPGPIGSNPDWLTVANGLLFFAADDGVSGIELWCSDGTAAGTRLVSDINPGAGSSLPQQLVGYNGALYFSASNGVGPPALWRSDGTAAGTIPVSNLGGSTPLQISVIDGMLHILTNNTSPGYANWISDGTTAGTVPASSPQLVSAIVSWSPVTSTTTGMPLTNLGGFKIYFGRSPAALTSVIDVPNPAALTYFVPDLLPGLMYFAVTAYISGGAESNLSEIVGRVL